MRGINHTIVCLALVGCTGAIEAPGSGGGDDTTGNPDPGGGDSNPPGGTDPAPGATGTGPYFETPMFWNRDVASATKASYSDAAITALRAAGGWGNSDTMHIDFSLDVLTAPAGTPMRTFEPSGDFYDPDCDNVAMPVPPNGNVEGESGYSCDGDGDCHLLVVDRAAGKLFEMWRANITGSFVGGCLAVWNTKATYGDKLRGDQCTSADAAGFPIAPLVFTADEVAAGAIDHAIRFILPNNRVKRGFVRPATHGTATTGANDALAYGSHLRLRADFPLASLPSEGARVVARAMQKYGMYHADGGNIALTAQSDRHTTAKWDGLLAPQDLSSLSVEDFEVVDHGAMVPLTYDCVR